MGYVLNLVIFLDITFQSIIMGNREINTGQGIQSVITIIMHQLKIKIQ